MSRVIKGSAVYVSQPKIIQIEELRELQEKYEQDSNKAHRSSYIKNYELEQSRLKQIRDESDAILRETESMVTDLLEKAREEASHIINEANDEAGQIKEDNARRGYEDGLEQARQDMENILENARQEKQQTIEEGARIRMQMLRAAEGDMLRLVMAIGRKVIGGEMRTNPEVVINVIADALSYLEGSENISVHINPQEVLQVLDAVNTGQIADKNNQIIDFEVKADNRVSPGGCIINSEEGQIDATLETRMTKTEKHLQGVIGDE